MRSKSVSPVSCGKGTRYSQPHDEGRLIVRLLRRGRTVRFGLQGTLLRREAEQRQKGGQRRTEKGAPLVFLERSQLAAGRGFAASPPPLLTLVLRPPMAASEIVSARC